jgi:hypothetical protein
VPASVHDDHANGKNRPAGAPPWPWLILNQACNAVAKGTSTLDRVRSIVLVIGYALSVVAALGVLFVGFTSLTADPSVSCARSLGKVDQGCRAQIALLQPRPARLRAGLVTMAAPPSGPRPPRTLPTTRTTSAAGVLSFLI